MTPLFPWARCLNIRTYTETGAAHASTALQGLEFIQGARPIRAQQPRQSPIRKHPALGLAPRAIIGFIVGIADALHRLAASRARLAVVAASG
jgi:hypothetical protein